MPAVKALPLQSGQFAHLRQARQEPSKPTTDELWAFVVRRSNEAPVPFVYAVTTTFIYCIPACPSRTPNRLNVLFFFHPHDAEKLGFRPCLKCCPNLGLDFPFKFINRACASISANPQASIPEIARSLSVSTTHFHRLFKKHSGLTPKHYFDGVRTLKIRKALIGKTPTTQAIFNAGHRSISAGYAQIRKELRPLTDPPGTPYLKDFLGLCTAVLFVADQRVSDFDVFDDLDELDQYCSILKIDVKEATALSNDIMADSTTLLKLRKLVYHLEDTFRLPVIRQSIRRNPNIFS